MVAFAAPIIPNLIIFYIVNPEDEKLSWDPETNRIDVEPKLYNRVPYMLQVLSYYYALIGIVGSLLISAPKRTLRRDMLFMKMD